MTTPTGVFRSVSLPFLTLGVFAVPLTFALTLSDTFDLPKMTLTYVWVILLLAAWMWQRAARGIVWYSSPTFYPLLVFLLVTAASVGVSMEPRLSVCGAYRQYVFGWCPLVAFAALVWITAQLDDERREVWIAKALVTSAALVGLYALLQYSGDELFEAMPRVVHGRPWSSLGNPLYLGAVCMMGLPVAQALWARTQTPRLVLALASVGMLTGLALSLSRSAWMGALAGVLTTALLLWRSRSTGRSRAAWPFLLLLGLAVGIGLRHSAVRERASLLLSRQEGSNAARWEGWKVGLLIWRHHPLLGTGADTFNRSFRGYRTLDYVRAAGPDVTQANAHNDEIQLAATEGILGLLAFLALLFVVADGVLQRAVWAPETHAVHPGWAGALVALWVQDQFNFSTVSTSFWAAVLIGLLASRRGRTLPALKGARASGWKVATAVTAVALLALAARPVVADWYYRQGQVEAQGGYVIKADNDYARAHRLNPGISVYQTDRANLARQLGQLAQGHAKNDWFSLAVEIARSETREHPYDPDSWNNLGVAAMWATQLNGSDHNDEARQAFEKSVALDPMYVQGWANEARWQHLAGHLDREHELWEKVLTIDPTYAFARQVLGRGNG